MYKLKNHIKDSIIILICTIILILVGELLFQILYSFSKGSENYKIYSRYFENKKEYENKIHKNSIFKNPYLLNTFYEKDKKKKVAVFGGSTALGHGSSLNFTNIISEILKEDFIFHNYSIEGATFNDHMITLINKVEKYYDYLIIYSGHNEIWSNLYRRNSLYKENLKIPNNVYKFSSNDYIKNFKKRIQLLDIKSNNLNKLIYKFTHHSRTYYFFEKIIFKINRHTDVKISQDININVSNKDIIKKNEKIFPLFINKQFLTNENKKNISENFLNKLKSIHKKKIILVLPPSNLLYPPNLDYLSIDYYNYDLEKLVLKMYLEYNKKNIQFLEQNLDLLPDTAHKSFFSGIICLSKNNMIMSKSNCSNYLNRAIQKDQFPTRILPNLKIKAKKMLKKNKNIIIIDPEKNFLYNKNSREYLNLFIDYHHLSTLGHYYIANQITEILYPNKKLKFLSLSDCDELKIQFKKDKIILFENSKENLNYNLNNNILWLKSRINEYQIDYLHKYYLNNSLIKLNKCNKIITRTKFHL